MIDSRAEDTGEYRGADVDESCESPFVATAQSAVHTHETAREMRAEFDRDTGLEGSESGREYFNRESDRLTAITRFTSDNGLSETCQIPMIPKTEVTERNTVRTTTAEVLIDPKMKAATAKIARSVIARTYRVVDHIDE